MATYSRREFLRTGTSALLGAALGPATGVDDGSERLGRVAAGSLHLHLQPSAASRRLGRKFMDEVFEIYEDVAGEGGQVWHHVSGGYVLAGEVQPVARKLNPVVSPIGEGFVGEVTVPYLDARRKPDSQAPLAYRLYYASTIWVRDVIEESGGQAWYKVYDERLGIYFYAPARGLRRIPASELSAISPHVTEKRILVDLSHQRLTAYEGKTEVFSTLISSGRLYLASDGVSRVSWTPSGGFVIDRKRPSRHMGNGDSAGSDYELPGVPWVSYFHWKGFSFHGTWWHNDFGRPRSAGCINMLPLEARWLYRWSHPTPLPDQELTTGEGTRVEIVEG
jgi:lipoprotein-anchoring transpeptidase ErfK/SrfK